MYNSKIITSELYILYNSFISNYKFVPRFIHLIPFFINLKGD